MKTVLQLVIFVSISLIMSCDEREKKAESSEESRYLGACTVDNVVEWHEDGTFQQIVICEDYFLAEHFEIPPNTLNAFRDSIEPGCSHWSVEDMCDSTGAFAKCTCTDQPVYDGTEYFWIDDVVNVDTGKPPSEEAFLEIISVYCPDDCSLKEL